MSEIPRLRVDRAAAEQLLSGGRPGGGELDQLFAALAAVSSPGPSGELPGERAAMAAFRAHRAAADRQNSRGAVRSATAAAAPTVPVAPPLRKRRVAPGRRRTVHRSWRTGLAAVSAALAVGGVAFAAEGVGPGQLFGGGHGGSSHPTHISDGPLSTGASATGTSAPPSDTSSPLAIPPGAPSDPTASSGSTAAALRQCTLYRDSSGKDKEKAAKALAATAGGSDLVERYCAGLESATSSASASDQTVSPSAMASATAKDKGKGKGHGKTVTATASVSVSVSVPTGG